MKVTAVIPSYNGQHLLAKYLPAVVRALRAGDELLVVDDASSDETVSWFTTWKKTQQKSGSTFSLIENKTNQRFAKSVNRGVREAQGDLIWLLNNDVKPRTDALEKLLPYFIDDWVFAVGSMEVDPKEPAAEAGKNKLWFERGMYMHSKADSFESGPTAWASGGSALFSKDKWLKLKGFDTAYYPAYWEDIDLSFRAKKRGWQVLFEANSVVEHHHETTNQDVFGQQQMEKISWRNAQLFTWKHSNLWQRLAYMAWRPYWWWKRFRHQSVDGAEL